MQTKEIAKRIGCIAHRQYITKYGLQAYQNELRKLKVDDLVTPDEKLSALRERVLTLKSNLQEAKEELALYERSVL